MLYKIFTEFVYFYPFVGAFILLIILLYLKITVGFAVKYSKVLLNLIKKH